jgi:hypothetical protein
MSHRLAFGPVVLLVVCMLSTSSGVVRAQAAPAAATGEGEEKARAHFRLGRAYYENGDFAQAAAEFESAYRISQRAQLLYNIYLAYRDANDTRHSAEALRQYLKLEKEVENRGQLEARLAALDRSLAEEQAKPVTAPAGAATAQAPAPLSAQDEPPTAQNGTLSGPATPPPTAARSDIDPSQSMARPVANPADSRPTPNHTLPIVLMASGGALVAGSVVTGLMVLGKRSDLAAAETQCKKLGTCDMLPAARVSELESKRSSGQTLAVVTDVLLFGGLAVAATGAALFLLSSGGEARPEAQRASLSFACKPGACAGRIDLAF